NEILQSCEELFSETAKSRGIDLIIERADIELNADKDKLLRVLSNLLSNALKFTPREGKVSLSATRENNELRLIVEDTGPGIPKDKLDSVFERFQQEGSQASKATGSGLGLTISKMFVELHGGAISVESEPGSGCAFTIILPATTR